MQLVGIGLFVIGIFCVAESHFVRVRGTRLNRDFERPTSEQISLARLERFNEVFNGSLPHPLNVTSEESKVAKLPSYEEATKDLPSYTEVIKS